MTRASLLVFAAVLAVPTVATAKPDRALTAVSRKLPQGWQMHVQPRSIEFRRAGPVWSLYGNRINAPALHESTSERRTRVTGLGEQVQASLTYRLERRWSKRTWARARRNNRKIYALIAGLPSKYKLGPRTGRSRKRSTYAASTPAERSRLTAYRRERAQLKTRLVKLPTCDSTKHSLFFVRSVGESDAFHEIHPESASRELERVRKLLRAGCLAPPR